MRRVRRRRRHPIFAVTPIAATPPRTIGSSMLPEPASRYESGAMRGILVAARDGAAVRRDLQRDALEECPVGVSEGRGLVGVDVDLADDRAVVRDRDDDLRARGREA